MGFIPSALEVGANKKVIVHSACSNLKHHVISLPLS